MKYVTTVSFLFVGIWMFIVVGFSTTNGAKSGTSRSSGSRTSGSSTRTSGTRTTGTGTGGTRTSGTRIGGTRTTDTRIGGTRTSGTRIGGTRTSGTRIGGTRTSGTRIGGSRSGTGSISRRTSWRRHGTWQTAGALGYIYGYNRYTTRRRFRDYPNEEPRICSNDYAYQMNNGSYYNFFICPLHDHDDSYVYCCGPDASEHCCPIFEYNSQLANSWSSTSTAYPRSSWSSWSSWSQPSWASWTSTNNNNWSSWSSWSSWSHTTHSSSSKSSLSGAVVGGIIAIIVLVLIIIGVIIAIKHNRNRPSGTTTGTVVSGPVVAGADLPPAVPPTTNPNDGQQMQPLAPAVYPPAPAQPYPPPAQPYPPPAQPYPPPAQPYAPHNGAPVYPPPSAASPYQPGFSENPAAPSAPPSYPPGEPPSYTAVMSTGGGGPVYGATDSTA